MILLFAYKDYYPSGGDNDLIAIANTLEEAENFLYLDFEDDYEYFAHAYDTNLRKRVKSWMREDAWGRGEWIVDENPWTDANTKDLT